MVSSLADSISCCRRDRRHLDQLLTPLQPGRDLRKLVLGREKITVWVATE